MIDAVLTDLHVKLLTEEEFRTLLSEAARVVNSTPLWTMSDIANEPMPLSPAMILNQRETECSEGRDRNEEEDPAAYGPRRWKRMNFLKNRFWQEWSRYYLFERPYGRTKWLKTRPNAKPGDVVLMREKNRPRLDWNEGMITQVKVDEDGLVRKAMVKPIHREGKATTTQERERAVHDLVFLNSTQSSPTESPGDSSDELGPVEPSSCNKLNVCPFCDLDLTTGGLNRCYPFHRAISPKEFYRELRNQEKLPPTDRRIDESDDEAYARLSRMGETISDPPVTPEAHSDPRNTIVPPTLRSGVTFL